MTEDNSSAWRRGLSVTLAWSKHLLVTKHRINGWIRLAQIKVRTPLYLDLDQSAHNMSKQQIRLWRLHSVKRRMKQRRIYWSWYWYYYRRVHSRAALLHRLDNNKSRPGHKFQSCTTNKWQHVVSGSTQPGDGVANMFLMSVCVMTLRLPSPEHSPTLDKWSSYRDHWHWAGVIKLIQT